MVRRLIAVLLLLIVAGCDAQPPQPPAAPPVPAPVLDPAQVGAVLLDSWVTDGDRGFFVDGAGLPAGPAFSLYDTRWELELARDPAATVDPAAVRRWVVPRMTTPGASDLPAIARLDSGLRILQLVGAAIDRPSVRAGLAALRHEWGYRAGTAAAGADWGSTAVALRWAGDLDLPVPAATGDRIRAALSAPGDPAYGLSSPTAAVALLESAAALPAAGGPPPGAAGLVRSVAAALDRAEQDPAWLSLQVALRRSATALHVALPRLGRAHCATVVAGPGATRLPGQENPDPQAVKAALDLGCRGVHRPAGHPHSRAGWPTREALRGAVAASAAGLLAARSTGSAAAFGPALTRQVLQVWLRQREPAPGAAAAVRRVNLKLLADRLGVDVLARVARALPWSGPPAGPATDAMIRLTLAEAALAPVRDQAALGTWLAPALARPDAPSALRAAWLLSAAHLLNRPELAERARTMLARLALAPGVYAAVEAGRPALTASVLGAAVQRDVADLPGRWAQAGLCMPGGCAETPDQVVPGWSLRALATVLTGQRGKAGPVAF